MRAKKKALVKQISLAKAFFFLNLISCGFSRLKTKKLSVLAPLWQKNYKSNSSPIDKESFLTAVESGAFILIKERALPEI